MLKADVDCLAHPALSRMFLPGLSPSVLRFGAPAPAIARGISASNARLSRCSSRIRACALRAPVLRSREFVAPSRRVSLFR